MTRKYNDFLTDGTAALKRDRRFEEGSGFKVVCTRGAKRPVVIDEEYVARHTVGYREYVRNSANDIADAIEYGTAKGQSAAFFTRNQVALIGFATAVVSLASILL